MNPEKAKPFFDRLHRIAEGTENYEPTTEELDQLADSVKPEKPKVSPEEVLEHHEFEPFEGSIPLKKKKRASQIREAGGWLTDWEKDH